jgi:hypothetical protein
MRLTTITVQRHQQLAVCCCGDRGQESNRVRIAAEGQSVTRASARIRGMHDAAPAASSLAAAA